MNDFRAIVLRPLCPGCREEDDHRAKLWRGEPPPVPLVGPAHHDELCGRDVPRRRAAPQEFP